ncbi:unnamed protein product [Staurois parvus]|uniref:Uncharacterized protein n=1 Tax=Staurois parvus TaxID=386267 RepID=A0ABN9C605_9NEOB|nr:unnamed protein product [Staurois parvus]
MYDKICFGFFFTGHVYLQNFIIKTLFFKIFRHFHLHSKKNKNPSGE